MEKNVIFSQIQLEDLKEIIGDCIREEFQKNLNSQSNTSDELIRIDDAAKLFHVSKVTLYKWREKGILPFHRISSRIYFKKSEIMEILNKSTKKQKK